MGFNVVRIKIEHILLIWFVTSPMKRILIRMSKTYVRSSLSSLSLDTDVSLEGGAREFYYLEHVLGG